MSRRNEDNASDTNSWSLDDLFDIHSLRNGRRYLELLNCCPLLEVLEHLLVAIHKTAAVEVPSLESAGQREAVVHSQKIQEVLPVVQGVVVQSLVVQKVVLMVEEPKTFQRFR